eukprot:1283961-Pyramimonas_sp.AAC.1
MDGGPFSNVALAAETLLKQLRGIHGWRAAPFSKCGSRLSAAHKWCAWHAVGRSGRHSHVASRCGSRRNGILA